MANASYSSSPGAVYNSYEAPEFTTVPPPPYPTNFSHSEPFENWLDPCASLIRGTSYSSSPGEVYNSYEAPESIMDPLSPYPTNFSHSKPFENWLDPCASFIHGDSRSFFLPGHPQFGSAESGAFSGNSNVGTFNESPSNAGMGMPLAISTNALEQTVCSLRRDADGVAAV